MAFGAESIQGKLRRSSIIPKTGQRELPERDGILNLHMEIYDRSMSATGQSVTMKMLAATTTEYRNSCSVDAFQQ
jgi:hypothetical protein